MRITLLAILLSATSVSASDELFPDADISEADWRNLALGKTLTYRIGDTFFALERYAISGNRVEIQLSSGECLSGTWSHSGNAYCYSWESSPPVCFRHLNVNDEIIVVQVENGQPTDNIQTMTNISEAPLSCGQNLS